MSFTYGFYNAVNHDRVYDARQLGAIFDGIIRDGVYESQGERFIVRPASQGMGVTVGSGRAWFDHTWSYNDSLLPLNIAMSDVLLSRIDAIVLETNTSEAVRSNSIKVITGTPSESPTKPSIIRSEDVNQYPLAYITVPAGSTSINAANIENAVGTSACPYVTGLLQVITIDNLVAQWQAQWHNYIYSRMSDFDDWSDQQKTDMIAWITNQEAEFLAWKNGFKSDAATWQAEFEADTVAWRTRERARWEDWFRNIQYVLDGDAAGHLQVEIDMLEMELNHQMASLRHDFSEFTTEVNEDVESYKEVIDERTFTTLYSMCNANIEFFKDAVTGKITEIHTSNSDLSATSIITFENGVPIDTITERVTYDGYIYTHNVIYNKETNNINESYTKEAII